MSGKKEKRKILKKKLFSKNRLVILNENTFEEIFSLRLTLMNVFVVATLGAVIIIFITTYIIAFTPLREYIPGYSSSKLKKDATTLALKSDSLTNALLVNEQYIASIRKVLTNEVDFIKQNKDSIKTGPQFTAEDLKNNPSEAELKLRNDVASEDKYNLFEKAQAKVNLVLFAPVKGSIIRKYSPTEKHFAVEIAVVNNAAIKAVANGTVIFSDWSPTNGYVVIIKHSDGLMSVYKQCESTQVSQGEIIRASQVIAMAGNSGNKSSGYHLRFELWKDGYTIDPTQFISFE